jgi:hypothetical protein
VFPRILRGRVFFGACVLYCYYSSSMTEEPQIGVEISHSLMITRFIVAELYANRALNPAAEKTSCIADAIPLTW